MAQASNSPLRLPLTPTIDTRDGQTNKDAKLVNGFLEKDAQGEVWCRKRLGLASPQIDVGASGTGLGVYYWQVGNSLLTITGDGKVRNGQAVTLGTVDTSGSYWFNETLGTPNYVYMSNGVKAYTYSSSAAFAQITDVSYPSATVPGSAYVDGTLYVMDQSGKIWGSKNLNDPTAWDPLNEIPAQIEPDLGVAIAKQLIYVVAFKTWTTEIFYDAGQPIGSPLLPVQNAQIPIGCAAANTVEKISDDLYFVGQNRQQFKSAFVISGMKVHKISTEAVDRMLNIGGYTIGFQMTMLGHRFYCISSLILTPQTLAYDLETGEWQIWTENSTYLDVAHSSPGGNPAGSYLQSFTGNTLRVPSGYYDETPGLVSEPIVFDAVTTNFDGSTRSRKVLSRLKVIADQNSAGSLLIRWSDDDYKTWSDWQTVNLQEEFPQLTQLGTFRRRAFQFRHQNSTPFRMKAAELDVLLGSF